MEKKKRKEKEEEERSEGERNLHIGAIGLVRKGRGEKGGRQVGDQFWL